MTKSVFKWNVLKRIVFMLILLSSSVNSFSQNLVVEVKLKKLYVSDITLGFGQGDVHNHNWDFNTTLYKNGEVFTVDKTENRYRCKIHERDGGAMRNVNKMHGYDGFPLSFSDKNDFLIGFPQSNQYTLLTTVLPHENSTIYKIGVSLKYFINKNNDKFICHDDKGFIDEEFFELDLTQCKNGVVTKTLQGGCNYGQYRSYEIEVRYHVNHVSLPAQVTICEKDIEAGIVLSEYFNSSVHGYDGTLQNDNFLLDETEVTSLPQKYVEYFKSPANENSKKFKKNIYTPYYKWMKGNEVIQNSYTGEGMSSIGKIYESGTYQLYTGYVIDREKCKREECSPIYQEQFIHQDAVVSEVNIISVPSPILDHVEDEYIICPGEILTLGAGYSPVGSNLLATEDNFPADDTEPIDPNSPYAPSPNEFDDDIEPDGIDFLWTKIKDANENSVGGPNGECMGYTESMDFYEAGTYKLEITHHYYHEFSNSYDICSNFKEFVIRLGDGPKVILEPYVELCNVNSNGEITIQAYVCPDPNLDCEDDNNWTTTGNYDFEWSRGGVVLNPTTLSSTLLTGTPGMYTLKVTEIINGNPSCYTIKQIEVLPCNEENLDEIVPLALINRLENVDTDQSGTSDFEENASILVSDPADCLTTDLLLRQATVRLNYHRGQQTDIMGADEWVLKVEYDLNGVAAETPLIINNFTHQPTYLALNKHDLQPCVQDVTLEITAINIYEGSVNNGNSTLTMDDLPEDIHLELEQNVFRLSPLSNNAPEIQSVEDPDADYRTVVEWNPVEGAIEYELMIAFEDEFMDSDLKLPSVNEDDFFKNYGYKIETKDNRYTLDVTYPSGKLYFKVRAIGRFIDESVGSNYSFRKNGPWSIVESLALSNGFHDQGISGIDNKSWQKTITFAEDGKHKEVVSYFDNMMRNEGVVTHLNSDGTVLRAHTFYDHEGRPTLQTLPFAEFGTSLQFEAHGYETLDDQNNPVALDKTHFDFGIQPQLVNSYGSAKYYSDQNDIRLSTTLGNQFPNMDYIPDADGYVTTQSVFKNDGTGRVIRQSGVGSEFRLRGPNEPHHETRYFYATATSTELRRLFGSNVGNPNHYKKQAVLDPNGQVSVSYLDMQDRVIATGLSGKTPDNLVSLENDPEEFIMTMTERDPISGESKNAWNPGKNAFVLTHEILNTVEATEYEFNYDIKTIVNRLKYIFPGQKIIYHQNYISEENYDINWATLNGWTVTNGGVLVEDGMLKLENSYAINPNFEAILTLDVTTQAEEDYLLLVEFKRLHEAATIAFNTGSGWTPLTLSNGRIFEYFEGTGISPQLKITFPNVEQTEDLGSFNLVKVYAKEYVPMLQTQLLFEGTDIEDDGDDNTNLIAWSGDDVAGVISPSYNDVAEFYEKIGDGETNTDAEFEVILEVTIPPTDVDRDFEVLYNLEYFDSEVDIEFFIDGVNQGNVKVVNFHELDPIAANTSKTYEFKWASQQPIIPTPNTFKKKLMELNYFKIFEIMNEANPDIFEFCESCEYELKTYIIDENGNKVALENINVAAPGNPVTEINATISKEGVTCSSINETELVGENFYDLQVGSEVYADGNTYNEVVINTSPELNYTAEFQQIGTYTVYKELVLNSNGLSADLNALKDIIKEGYLYNYIKEQEAIVDVDAICAFTCEDACAAQVVATINEDLGYDIFDTERVKVADLHAVLSDNTHPDYTDWSALYDQCINDNFCESSGLVNDELSLLSSEAGCLGMEGQMLEQITSPEKYYGDIENNPDQDNNAREEAYYEFLYATPFNLADFNDLEGILNISEDGLDIEGKINRIGEIRDWVDALFAYLDDEDNASPNVNPFDIDFTNVDDVVKGKFIFDHWNGVLTTNQKEFLMASVANPESYTSYEDFLERSGKEVDYSQFVGVSIESQIDWENYYVVFHREYPHYAYCILDVEGRAHILNMRKKVSTWTEARHEGYLYPLSDHVKSVAADYHSSSEDFQINGGFETSDPLFENEPFKSWLSEFESGEDHKYLNSFEKLYNEDEYVNIWQFLDENGAYGCVNYGSDEDHVYDDEYLETNNNIIPNYPNCWPDPFEVPDGFELEELKWQKFVNLYSGQREELKKAVFVDNGGAYYEDEYAINLKPIDGEGIEEINNGNNPFPQEMCESQCESNVLNWIEGLKAYCEEEEWLNYEENASIPISYEDQDIAPVLATIAANNTLIDGLADEFSELCLENCVPELLTAYLSQESLDDYTDQLYTILASLNLSYLNTDLAEYITLPEEDKPNHILEQLFITRVVSPDPDNTGDEADCATTCSTNAAEWLTALTNGWNCSLSSADEAELITTLENLCLEKCGPLNPLGWLNQADQEYLAEVLMNLPDPNCFSDYEIDDFYGTEGVIEQVFIEDGMQIVYDYNITHQACSPSNCLEGIVDFFWQEDQGPVTSYTSADCSFEVVNFQEDYVTLIDDEDCADGSNCFTTLFWVDEDGNRIHLTANGPQVSEPVYTSSSPIIIPEQETPHITPEFANYSATLLPNPNTPDASAVIDDTYCEYISSGSNFFTITEGLEVPYITQLLDGNGVAIKDGQGYDVLDGTTKYYLYPVQGHSSLEDLNAILKTVFNSDRTDMVSFNRIEGNFNSNQSTTYSFECVEALLNHPEVDFSKKTSISNCIAASLSEHGEYREADFTACHGSLNALETSICNDVTTAKQYSIFIQMFDVPESIGLAKVEGHFGGEIEELDFKIPRNCVSQPVVDENCLTVCSFETAQSQFSSEGTPYITQIYNNNNEPILDGSITYHLGEGNYNLENLAAFLSNNFGTNIEIEFETITKNNNGCNSCPPPSGPTCICFTYNTYLSYENFTVSKMIFTSTNNYGLVQGGNELVSYSGGSYTMNQSGIDALEASLASTLSAPIEVNLTLNESGNGVATVELSLRNVPADVTEIQMLSNTTGNLDSWEKIEGDCALCYDPLYDPESARTFDSCQSYLKILNEFSITVNDTTDCQSIDSTYSAFNTLTRSTEYAYKLLFKNVPESLGTTFKIDFVNGTSEVLTASKIDECELTTNCVEEGETVYLYSISFDHTGNSCGSSLDENCITWNPVLAVVMDGQTEYTYPTNEELLQICQQNWQSNVMAAANTTFEDEWADLNYAMADAFINACKEVEENYTYEYLLDEHHYTLYYYDNSGALLQTIPPEGVEPLTMASFPAVEGVNAWNGDEPLHYLRTRYKYNSRNQVVWQQTPDAGQSLFWYNKVGQLILSQDAQQALDNQYSFTTYDAHGRIIWVGEIDVDLLDNGNTFATKYSLANYPVEDYPVLENVPDNAVQIFLALALDDGTFPFNDEDLQPALQDLTHTVYDRAVFVPNLAQRNLRNRVAASFRFDDFASYEAWKMNGNSENVNFTAYTYDEIGNVDALVQHIGLAIEDVNSPGNFINQIDAYKRVDYEYDLVSGNVNRVIYQKNVEDELFIHRYEYDADNRITHVYTSRDGVIEQLEAEYFYYPHGPLARVEIGEDKVQAQDYYYTLQGWLKGVNGNDINDPGKDGQTGLNEWIAKDEFAFQLGYYNQDYSGIGNTTINQTNANWSGDVFWDQTHNVVGFNNILEGDVLTVSNDNYMGLYNGNIGQMISYLPSMGNNHTLVNHYQYDQLNRIKGAVGKIDGATTAFYQTAYNFDAMGNIVNLYRTGIDENDAYQVMDNFSYDYHKVDHPADNLLPKRLDNNKLKRVEDINPLSNGLTAEEYADIFNSDIDHQTNLDNYSYDAIGNLISDDAEGIASIEWDVYGKITDIVRGNVNNNANDRDNLSFGYDAAGNRIIKIVKPQTGGVESDPSEWHYTYYSRDAQGNILTTHEEIEVQPNPLVKSFTNEYNIYGSGRIGLLRDVWEDPNQLASPDFSGDFTLTKTLRNYELSNHLGNVMAIVTDLKQRGEALRDDFVNSAGSWGSNSSIELEGGSSTTQVTSTLNGGRLKIESSSIDPNAVEELAMAYKDYTTIVGNTYKLEAYVDIGEVSQGFIGFGSNFEMEFATGKWSVEFTADDITTKAIIAVPLDGGAIDKTFWLDEVTLYDITANSNDVYYADVRSAQDYYPYGMLLANRTYNAPLGCEEVITLNHNQDIIDDNFDGAGTVVTWSQWDGDMTFTIVDDGSGTNDVLEIGVNGEVDLDEDPNVTEMGATGGLMFASVEDGNNYTVSFDLDLDGLDTDNNGTADYGLLLYVLKVGANGIGFYDETQALTDDTNPISITIDDVESGHIGIGFRIVDNTGTNPVVDGAVFRIDNFNVNGTEITKSYDCNSGSLASNYRFGFNGMELDNEVSGQGNAYTAFYRGYDSRIVRWKSLDPVTHEWQSPYSAMDNNPILYNDVNGNCKNCDKYNDPNGNELTVPSGTEIISQREDGSVGWFVHNNIDYIYDETLNGFYGMDGEERRRWKNPNAQWHDPFSKFWRNSVSSAKQFINDPIGSLEGVGTVIAEQERISQSKNPFLNKSDQEELAVQPTPATDILTYNLEATFKGMPDWGYQEWAYVGTEITVSFAGSKGLGYVSKLKLVTADGFLIGSIKMRAPFDLHVQRFGYYSNKINHLDYWGPQTFGTNKIAARTFNAIHRKWGNPLTRYNTGIIPKGTPIKVGITGPQGWRYPGGLLQYRVQSAKMREIITRFPSGQ